MTLIEALKYAAATPPPPDPTKVKRAAEVGYDLPPFGQSQQKPPPFATSVSDMPVLDSVLGDVSASGARTVSPDRLPKRATPPPLPPQQKPIGQRPVTPTKPGGYPTPKRAATPEGDQLPPSLAKVSGAGWELVEDAATPKPKMGAKPSFTLLTPESQARFRKALESLKKSQSSSSAPAQVQWEQGLQPPTE